MKAVLDIGVLCVTLLLMVTAGMELVPGDFRAVGRRKWTLLGALLLPAIFLPLLGLGLARLLDLPPHLTAGLLLLAACPVGDISNFYTLLARGNLALSVSVNVLSCLFSVATMAFAFALYGRLLGNDFTPLALPTVALELRLLLLVALPLLAGMAVRRWRQGWADRHQWTLQRLSLAGTAFLLVYVLLNRWAQVAASWQQTALAGLIFIGIALLAGRVMARLLRADPADTIALGIGCATRNVALATAIAITLLNRIEFAEVAVVYLLIEIPLLLGVAGAYRRWGRHAAPAGARP